jgi:hypothetical protein
MMPKRRMLMLMAKDKIMYKGSQEIEGSIISDNGRVVVIQLDAGGTITLEKADITVKPAKEPAKKTKRGRKPKQKENDEAVFEQFEEKSEEQSEEQ